ncbi:MAG: glycosyltransferase family 4 protein [Candidatus Omnitrophica bacterium]|nr:glycosyltransferase family 4 protein [Candidatus Omnitrophota bacterium]
MKNVLLIPGFLSDTFSTVEKLSFHLTEILQEEGYSVVWLVQDVRSCFNVYKNSINVGSLNEPVYVTELKKCKITFVTKKLYKFNLIKDYFIFKEIIKNYKIDCVIVQFGLERFYAAMFSKIFGVKVIWYERWASLHSKFWFLKKIFYHLFVDFFIANSEFTAKTLPRNKRIFILQNSIEVKKMTNLDKTEKNLLKLKLNLENFKYIVLMIAAFRSEKRYDLAIEILKRILLQRKDVCFVFLGNGELREFFLKLVDNLNLQDNVMMPGHVNNIEEFLLVADVLMLTSFNEPFGNCIIEGMSYSLPVVSFNNGGPAEIIKDNETGYLVPFGDVELFSSRLSNILKNDELRKVMGEKGFCRVNENFNILNWKIQIPRIFNEISAIK